MCTATKVFNDCGGVTGYINDKKLIVLSTRFACLGKQKKVVMSKQCYRYIVVVYDNSYFENRSSYNEEDSSSLECMFIPCLNKLSSSWSATALSPTVSSASFRLSTVGALASSCSTTIHS